MTKNCSKRNPLLEDIDERYMHAQDVLRAVKRGEIDIRHHDYWSGYRDCAKALLLCERRQDEVEDESEGS